MNLLRCSCLVVLLTSLSTMTVVAEENGKENPANVAKSDKSNVASDFKNISKSTEVKNESESNQEIESAPAYNKLLPILGWNRYSGDTAVSIREWKRCWKYLNLKKNETFIMKWINNLNIRIYPGNEVFRALYVRGIYDPNLVVVIDALLPYNGSFIDIGSNMGYCSLIMSKSVGEEGKVYAIEPSERDFLRLVDNVNLNKLSNVNVYRLAISDVIGKVKISIASEERSALNTLGSEFSNKGIEKERTEVVESTTLDTFVDKENLTKIDVIKMDIEGSEVNALKGAKNTIEKFRPALIIGINKNSLEANKSSISQVEAIMKQLRYKMYYLCESPFFALKETETLKNLQTNRIICLHESFTPPVLPQPNKVSFMDKVKEFFKVD